MHLESKLTIDKELVKQQGQEETLKYVNDKLHNIVSDDVKKIFKAKKLPDNSVHSYEHRLSYHVFSEEVLNEVLYEIQDAVKDCFGSIPLRNYIYDRLKGNTTLTFKEMGFKSLKE